MAPEHRLPTGLLIILHLHLLHYPLQDAAGYDERLFDHARGMRDRNKAMEDITYFLVGKLEGSKERAKSILPTYPCLQPSDTTAYRIALAKYLEGLRNAIAHTKNAQETDPRGKQRPSSAEDEASAWWWKDVVVRKSILDECSGDRFERLILALSTHAVLNNSVRMRSPSSSLHPAPQSSGASYHHDRGRDLGSLSGAYTIQLATAQDSRLEWERSAALLVQRQVDLAVIRARIADPKLAASSKYESLATDRLLALRDSRYHDLLRGSWQGDDGRPALRLVTDLAGLLDASTGSTDSQDTGIGANVTPSRLQVAPETSPPLPIAAAHHPAHLHSLRLPLFVPPEPSHTRGGDLQEGAGPSDSTPHAISERLAAVDKVHASLQDALASARSIHDQLQRSLQKAKCREPSQPWPKKVKGGSGLQLDASLWDSRADSFIDFEKVPDTSPALLARFSLGAAPSESAIEERIAHIRSALLPPFAADPVPASDSEPEERTTKPPAARQASRIPSRQPAARGQVALAAVPKANHPSGVATGRTVIPGASNSKLGTRQDGLTGMIVAIQPQRVPSGTGLGQGNGNSKSMKARRLSRRASAARTRRSTVFGRGDDAEILRVRIAVVASVEDRSDPSEEEEEEHDDDSDHGAGRDHNHTAQAPRTPFRTPRPRRTPAKTPGTRGTLLSTLKKSAPRQSFDIDKYERVQMPRLPSLGHHLEPAPEADEDDNTGMPSDRGDEDDDGYWQDAARRGDAGGNGHSGPLVNNNSDGEGEGEVEDDVPYEGNSMTLADILLQAGHQGNISAQLLEEDGLEGDVSDWE